MNPLHPRAVVFPLPYIMPPLLPRSSSRRIQRRRQRAFFVTARANSLVSSLNSLASNFKKESYKNVFSYSLSNSFTKNPPVTKLQARVLAAIYMNAASYVGRLRASSVGSSDVIAEPHALVNLEYMNRNYADFPNLIAKNVSLPTQAATASVLDLLPVDISARYASPATVLLPSPPRVIPKVRLLPQNTPQSEWEGLVKRLHSRGMVTFTSEPAAVNGVFVVPKEGEKLRLIINAVPFNALCVPPPHVDLPTPDVLGRLRLRSGSRLWSGKSDRDNFYHRLVIPAWMRPYLALPPVDASSLGLGLSGLLYPCCVTLPMGWSHSVYVAQTLHLFQIDKCGCFPVGSRVLASTDPYIDRFRHVVYIDDVGGLDPGGDSEKYMCLYEAHMSSVGLPGKASKRVPMSTEPLDLLGLQVSSDVVGVSAVKLERLLLATRRVLLLGSCTGLELLSLVSSWSWALLVRRLSLSTFGAVYRFVHVAKAASRLWPSVRRELVCVMGLVPVLSTGWSMPFDSRVLASDASLVGFGVVSANVSPDYSYHLDLQRNAVLDQEQSRLQHIDGLRDLVGRHWSPIVAAPVRFAAHINVLEALALLLAFMWRASLARPCLPTRVLTLVDSSVVFYALSKGRSSSRPLLKVFRRLSALLLASNVFPIPIWVPSDLNPADAPSRAPSG